MTSSIDQFGRVRPSPADIAAAFEVPDGLDELTAARVRVLAQTAAALADTGHTDLAIDATAFAIGRVPPLVQVTP